MRNDAKEGDDLNFEDKEEFSRDPETYIISKQQFNVSSKLLVTVTDYLAFLV